MFYQFNESEVINKKTQNEILKSEVERMKDLNKIRLIELKKIKNERRLTEDEIEELAYLENEVSSREAEENFLNGEE